MTWEDRFTTYVTVLAWWQNSSDAPQGSAKSVTATWILEDPKPPLNFNPNQWYSYQVFASIGYAGASNSAAACGPGSWFGAGLTYTLQPGYATVYQGAFDSMV
jgi:hypothetical protein